MTGIIRSIFCAFGWISSVAAYGAFLMTISAYAQNFETNIDRMGRDYQSFNLLAPDPQLCFAACEAERLCVAWTYVRPGVQGPTARCWLKNSVPEARTSSCCVSGVKSDPSTPSDRAAPDKP
jgi:PAN domain